MFNEQQKSILQILYERRSDLPYTFDREELADRIGKRWHEIQPDAADLEEKGYLVTKRNHIGSRIFPRLNITPKGVEFVEQPPQPLFRKIDVFISSPSDVKKERAITKRVLEEFNHRPSIAAHYFLRPLAYEDSVPAEMGHRPQDIVDRHMMKAGSCDLFICIFGHHMGTPVTHEETGEHFQSGTEYEFVDAYHHNQKHGKPYILLYRSQKPLPPDADPEPVKTVDAFFKGFEGEHAKFKGLYKTYRSNKDFEKILSHDIDAALSKNLDL